MIDFTQKDHGIQVGEVLVRYEAFGHRGRIVHEIHHCRPILSGSDSGTTRIVTMTSETARPCDECGRAPPVK